MEDKCEYCGAKSVRTIPVSGTPVYACGAYGAPGKQDGARSYTCHTNQIAQLTAANAKLKNELILFGMITQDRDRLAAAVEAMGDGNNPELWGELVKQRNDALAEAVVAKEAAEAENPGRES